MYLEKVFGSEEVKRRGVAIGYDHRASSDGALFSEQFALLSAAVCPPPPRARTPAPYPIRNAEAVLACVKQLSSCASAPPPASCAMLGCRWNTFD